MSAPTPPQVSPLEPGARIDNRYVVGEVIGRGGAGIVVAGHHLGLDAPVAIKFLKSSFLSHDARKRFIREARLTNRLKSAHAIQVLDVGELPSGELYLVMERLIGRSLDQELGERGPLPEHEAAELMAAACDAVGEAHALGIVHRDLKPQNMFLHRSPLGPILKVLDFGLSKELEGATPEHTRTFMFMGTPRYMPPEQWEPGAVADPRMDVYSLGIVLHELLTGKVPFEHLPVKQRVPLLLGGSVPDPRSVRPNVSERMAEIVMSCLRPRAVDRIPTARHLERLLRAFGTSSASSGAGGNATLMLSHMVQTRTAQGVVPSPYAPSSPPPRNSPVPPRLKPTSVMSSSPPPDGLAPRAESPSNAPPGFAGHLAAGPRPDVHGPFFSSRPPPGPLGNDPRFSPGAPLPRQVSSSAPPAAYPHALAQAHSTANAAASLAGDLADDDVESERGSGTALTRAMMALMVLLVLLAVGAVFVLLHTTRLGSL